MHFRSAVAADHRTRALEHHRHRTEQHNNVSLKGRRENLRDASVRVRPSDLLVLHVFSAHKARNIAHQERVLIKVKTVSHQRQQNASTPESDRACRSTAEW